MCRFACAIIDGMKRNESDYKLRYRRTVHGRAKTYLSYLARRCAKRKQEFNLTLEWFVHRLSNGRCEVTGIAFEYESKPNRNRSPWAFSIDRIDNTKGYTIANSQAVVWAYNAAKGEGSDDDVFFFARCLLGVIPLSSRGNIKPLPLDNKKL